MSVAQLHREREAIDQLIERIRSVESRGLRVMYALPPGTLEFTGWGDAMGCSVGDVGLVLHEHVRSGRVQHAWFEAYIVTGDISGYTPTHDKVFSGGFRHRLVRRADLSRIEDLESIEQALNQLEARYPLT